MNNCASSCGEIPFVTLTPADDCKVETRDRMIARVVFKKCDVDLPNPETNIAMKAMFDSNQITFSSLLANISFDDPSTDDFEVAECLPLVPYVNGRVFNAQDKIKRESTTISPAIKAKYEDYSFWQNKIDQMFNMNIGFEYCDGDVVWAKDANGDFLRASIFVWLNYEKITSGSTKRYVEYKSIRITFNGDPLALYNVPTWNRIAAGIEL